MCTEIHEVSILGWMNLLYFFLILKNKFNIFQKYLPFSQPNMLEVVWTVPGCNPVSQGALWVSSPEARSADLVRSRWHCVAPLVTGVASVRPLARPLCWAPAQTQHPSGCVCLSSGCSLLRPARLTPQRPLPSCWGEPETSYGFWWCGEFLIQIFTLLPFCGLCYSGVSRFAFFPEFDKEIILKWGNVMN